MLCCGQFQSKSLHRDSDKTFRGPKKLRQIGEIGGLLGAEAPQNLRRIRCGYSMKIIATRSSFTMFPTETHRRLPTNSAQAIVASDEAWRAAAVLDIRPAPFRSWPPRPPRAGPSRRRRSHSPPAHPWLDRSACTEGLKAMSKRRCGTMTSPRARNGSVQLRGTSRSRKRRICGPISSSLSSSAKWPVSRRCSSASGRSRR